MSDEAVAVRSRRPHNAAGLTPVLRAAGPVIAAVLLLATVPDTSATDRNFDLVVAAGLVATGAVAWFMTRWVSGGAAILAGASIGIVAAGVPSDSTPLRLALALAAAPLAAPLLALVISQAPAGWVALAGGIAAGPLQAAVYDPFLDPDCTARCLSSPLALSHSAGLAHDLHRFGLFAAAGALTTLAVGSGRRWQLLIVAAAAWAVFVGRAADLILVAAAVVLLVLAVELVEAVEVRRRVRALARSLGTTGEVTDVLRRELRDDGLSVAYWLDNEARFVTADGGEAPARRPGQETTNLRTGTELLARVFHDPRAAVRELAEAVNGSTRLALDNERLAAQVAVQLAALRESRSRIVEQSDTERRKIERDVHDSAQQHVLALGLELNTTLARLPDDDSRRVMVELCIAKTNAVLDELRELSHGIYPVSLEAGGLTHGLRTLSSRSRHPVRIVDVPAGRFDHSVERAAFALIADAAERTNGVIDVTIAVADELLTIRIDGASPPRGVVVDRVAAAGGALDTNGDTIVASFPCAS